jgi:hypothetical protein
MRLLKNTTAYANNARHITDIKRTKNPKQRGEERK